MIKLYEKSPVQLRLGVAGCGKVFERYYLPALKRCNQWNLVAICEPIKERREWVQKTLNRADVFDQFVTFLKESSLDAVVITTPPETHSAMAVQSLKMGLHVLVEKPMALNITEALLMREASLQKGKQLWVGFNRKFKRPYINVKDKMSHLSPDSIRKIFFQLILDPNTWQSVTPFMGDDSKGGGILDDVASHQVDLLSWLLDLRIKMVKAEYLVQNHLKAECILINLKFENDLVATCFAGHGNTYQEKLIIQTHNKTIVAYPAGVLQTRWLPAKWLDFHCKFGTFFHHSFCKLTGTQNMTLDSFECQLRSFAKAIRGQRSSPANHGVKSGVRSVQVIQACRSSLKSGGNWHQVGEEGELML
jgi:predicted dehydrogenase